MTAQPVAAFPPGLIDLWFVLPSGSLVLDWAGPAEAFRIANQKAAQPRFRLRFCGPGARSTGSVGLALADLEPLPERIAGPAWIVIVGVTSALVSDSAADEQAEVVRWLTRLRPGREGLRLVTVCTGAQLAARAGLLHAKRVTTHHAYLDQLAQLAPSATVLTDRVFVQDGEVWTSAGVSAGIDLALHLISAEAGPVVAARVAQDMAVALRRGPDDPQLSPFLSHRQHLNAKLHRVQDAVSHSPRDAWSAERMAELVHTTPRSLNRLFADHAQTTPLAYLRNIRVAVARSALSAGATVAHAADVAGFGSDLALRRAWLATGMPGSPSGRSRSRVMTSR
jgi:transcriptional regulator GlxA family with amidase domain